MEIKLKEASVGFLELLALLFIGLKLGGVINWSWWLVLSPVLVGLGFYTLLFVVLSVVSIAGFVVGILERRFK